MTVEVTFADAQQRLEELLDRASSSHETILIQRQDRPSVALIDADELASLLETAHVLSSPANAARLEESIRQMHAGEVVTLTEDVRAELLRGA